MNNAILPLASLGLSAAAILYIAARKFYVDEDPKIADVEEILPAANCGGCGYPGCNNFAEALVQADDLSSLYCPVGGNDTMAEVAEVLGLVAEEKEVMLAVIRCSGSPEHRIPTNLYDGASSCQVAASLYSGDTACSYGCLGLGDCEDACDFDALPINQETKLPEISEANCTACNACVEIIMKKVSPPLYQALGIFLPLITTNCAVLGVAILAIGKDYNLAESVVFAISNSIGFGLALVIFAGLREHLDLMEIPDAMKGVPIALLTAGLLSLAFMGFSGIV